MNPVKVIRRIFVTAGVVYCGLGYGYYSFFEKRRKEWEVSMKEEREFNAEVITQEIAAYKQWTTEQYAAHKQWIKEKVAAHQQWTKEEIADHQQWIIDKVTEQQTWAERELIVAEKKNADFFVRAGPILALDKYMTKRLEEIVKNVVSSKTMQLKVEKLANQMVINHESIRQLIPSDMMKTINEEFLGRMEEGSNAVFNDDKIPVDEKAKAVANLANVEALKREAKYFEHIARSMNEGFLDKLPRL